MSNVIDLEVDMGYFGGDIDGVYLMDENGEYAPLEFVPKAKYEKLDELVSKFTELKWVVGDFVDSLECEDCPMKRDCTDNNRILFCEPSYGAVEEMRDIIKTLNEMTSTAKGKE